MRSAAIFILVLIIPFAFVIPAHASNVSISVDAHQVKAISVLSVHQNMTTLPAQTQSLNMANDQELATAFTNALRQKSSTASPSDLTVSVDSSATWLNISTTMTVSGVSGRNGDALSIDMGWKSFSVQSDLRAGNLSYNTVGVRYLRPVAEFYTNASRNVGKPNATITGVSFLINKTVVAGGPAEDYVGNFTLLDFSSLSQPLETWLRTYSLSNDTTAWRFTPRQVLDISVDVQQEGNRTSSLFATYTYTAEIAVSGLAHSHGNIIVLDVGSGQTELAMMGIIAVTVVAAIAAQLSFRAKKKKYIKFGRW